MTYRTRIAEEMLRDGRVVWTAWYPDLLGCHAVGRDPVEASQGLTLAREHWMAIAEREGMLIPLEPDGVQVDIEFLRFKGTAVTRSTASGTATGVI